MTALRTWLVAGWHKLVEFVTHPFITAKHRAATDLGSVLLKIGSVNMDALEQAVVRQVQENKKTLLGQILVEMGKITEEELKTALHTQRLMRRGKSAEVMLKLVNTRADKFLEHLRGHS